VRLATQEPAECGKTPAFNYPTPCDKIGAEVNMSTAKDQISEILKRQPDDSSYDEIVRELAFDLMVQRGLKDSDDGRTISNDEMQRRIKNWQK
jgi:hypothetical protein